MWFTIIFLVLAGFAYAAGKGAPWVPTNKKDIDYLFAKIELPKNALIYDLGSGDGRVVLQACQQKNVSQAVGVELAWPLYVWSIAKTILTTNKNIKNKARFVLGNFFNSKIDKADLIFCFLMPKTINQLGPQIANKMKPGSLLVSAVFQIKSLTPTEIIRPTPTSCIYYIYQI